jgi:hypothetical protein
MSELKRTRQHIATLWSLTNGPGHALKCKCGQWELRGKSERRLREEHRAHRVEMGEWVKPRKTGPDWADLRAKLRAAGYEVRRTTPGGGVRNDRRGITQKTSCWEISPADYDPSKLHQPRGEVDLNLRWWRDEEDEGHSLSVWLRLNDGCGAEVSIEFTEPVQALAAATVVGFNATGGVA